MYNSKKNSYVMVEFTVLDWVSGDLLDNKIKERLNFTCPPIVEIAAVKIQNGKICEHYTNFIGLDGLNAENLSDDGDCMSHFGITHKDLSPKPAYLAYKTLTKMRPDGSSVPRITVSPDGIYTAEWTRPDGKKVHALWTARKTKKCVLSIRGKIESATGYLGQRLSEDPSAFTATPRIVYLTGPDSVTVK